MKNLIPCFITLGLAAFFAGCETTSSSTPRRSGYGATGSAGTGQKCQVCACKSYKPGRLIKDVCSDCGHTTAEHTLPAP